MAVDDQITKKYKEFQLKFWIKSLQRRIPQFNYLLYFVMMILQLLATSNFAQEKEPDRCIYGRAISPIRQSISNVDYEFVSVFDGSK